MNDFFKQDQVKTVLAIETSCDDTSVAVVDSHGQVFALCSATRDLDHEVHGGIVPEIASRNHTQYLLPLIEETLKKSGRDWSAIDGLAVTNRPGLIGALVVGISTAKSLALALNKPLVGVNHLEGHLLAPFLETFPASTQLNFPYLALAVSGGHTTLYQVHDFGKYHILGTTRDDAAGEAFDKFAKLVGLGFPGGVRVDQQAQSGNSKAFQFPRSMITDDNLEMSFSGLKSAAHRLILGMSTEQVQQNLSDLCASFQQAVVDVLLAKLQVAQKRMRSKQVVVTGGVSANSGLRNQAMQWAAEKKIDLFIPPLKYCTDNAAMIGLAGAWHLMKGHTATMDLGPSPQSFDADFIR